MLLVGNNLWGGDYRMSHDRIISQVSRLNNIKINYMIKMSGGGCSLI